MCTPLRLHRARRRHVLQRPEHPLAVLVNIEIMRTFVRLRRLLASNEYLARKLAALEKRFDAQFNVVFDAIRHLMAPTSARNTSLSVSPLTRSDSCLSRRRLPTHRYTSWGFPLPTELTDQRCIAAEYLEAVHLVCRKSRPSKA